MRDRLEPDGTPDPAEAARGLRVLLLHSPDSDVSEIRAFLRLFPDIAVVDVWNEGYETPGLGDLAWYNSVILASNAPFHNPTALGDVLADYVDAGGGLVLTLASFIEGYNVGGRLLTGGYLPFQLGYGPGDVGFLGSYDPNHPIMKGVTGAGGALLGTVSLASGAQLVASWDNGLPFVATRAPGVVAVNVFVAWSGYWIGDVPLVLRNAARWSSRTPWLSVSPTTGTVPAGQAVRLTATFDAAGLIGGDYDANVVVSSNDPDEPELAVGTHLHVTSAPDVEVSPTALDFGTLFVGASRSLEILVSNGGQDVLTVARIVPDHQEFSADPSSFTLGVGERRPVTVRYGPSGPGPVAATLTVESNDPDEPDFAVSLAEWHSFRRTSRFPRARSPPTSARAGRRLGR